MQITTVLVLPENDLIQKFIQGLHGLSVKPCHPTKSIDAVAIGAAKQLKQIYPNDSDFSEQSKIYPAYLAPRNHKPKQSI